MNRRPGAEDAIEMPTSEKHFKVLLLQKMVNSYVIAYSGKVPVTSQKRRWGK